MPASPARPIKRSRRLTDMIPINQPLDPAQIVIDRHQIVQTYHLHLPGLLTRPDRERSESHTHRLPVTPDETSTASKTSPRASEALAAHCCFARDKR